MEEGVDESRCECDERRQLRLEQVVDVLVLSRGELKVLLDLGSVSCAITTLAEDLAHLEGVPLIRQTLLLLGPQLVQAIIVSVIIDKLVIPLRTRLSNLLANVHQLLARLYDPRIYELEFGSKSLLDLFHEALVHVIVLQSDFGLRVFLGQVVFSAHG